MSSARVGKMSFLFKVDWMGKGGGEGIPLDNGAGVGDHGKRKEWVGGVPCVMRGSDGGDEGWVGGLNGLLKFNYPFGEEVG